MKMKLSGALIIASIAVSSFAFAQTAPVKTAKEIHKLDKKRVKEGVKSGELTKAEVKDIRTDNKDLKADVKDARADGKVTLAEKKKVARDEAKLSRNIYAKKHNARVRK